MIEAVAYDPNIEDEQNIEEKMISEIVQDIVGMDHPDSGEKYNDEENAEKLRRLDGLVLVLHDVVNDPSTREVFAEKKNNLVHDIAQEFLNDREEKEGGKNDWTIQKLIKTHERTRIVTHNTEVVIGDPSTGPSTIVMVHHDTILADKDKKSGKIPFKDKDGNILEGVDENGQARYCDENGTIYARTIQDNTFHLATTLANLHKIKRPEKGAIIFHFTDHEENGCLGSHALKEEIARLGSHEFAEKNTEEKNVATPVSPDYPVFLTALESTDGYLAIAHRGKWDAGVRGQYGNEASAAQVYASFYDSLFATQQEAYWRDPRERTQKDELLYEIGEDILGHNTGLSTTGKVANGKVEIELDFRTNGLNSPEYTSQDLKDRLNSDEHNIDDESFNKIVNKVIDNIEQRMIDIYVEDNGIFIQSHSDKLHPSTYNPENDETVLPSLYVILNALYNLEQEKRVASVEWGDANKRNSNPVTALIEGNFSLDTDSLIDAIYTLRSPTEINSSDDIDIYVDENNEVATGAVTPVDKKDAEGRVIIGEIDLTLEEILRDLNAKKTTVSFMTDIGALFNELKKENILVYPGVIGAGDSRRLHKDEFLTENDRLWFNKFLPKFIDTTHEKMVKKGKIKDTDPLAT